MSRLRSYDSPLGPDELATLRRAYEDACRIFDLDPAPADLTDHRHIRDMLAAAILAAAKIGERDPATLSAFAVAFSMRNRNLPPE
jgi:hypothetical protein